jgi:thioredoxin-related protein
MNKIARIIFFVLAGIVFPMFSFSQNSTEIKWMNFEEAVEKNKTEPKKIFIDVYTNWCGWCKRMDATTFRDSAVVSYMNKYFHAVKLDAETKDTIHFQGHEFVYHPENRANEIAFSLLKNKMSYPTSVYLDEAFSILSPVPGYLTMEQIMPVLKYYGDNIYKTKTWEDYSKEIMSAPAAPAQQNK